LCRLPHTGLLVLDDCHEISPDAPLHGLIVDCVRDIPRGATLVLIGRGEPPAVYTRLIANHTLGVLTPQDLLLTREETRAIASRISTDERLSEALHAGCEGWAAAVAVTLERLARQRADSACLGAEIRKACFNYFAGEVFDRAPPEERRILVATALLPHVSAQLAEEVSGTSQAHAILNKLADRQAFVSRKAGTPTIYEYAPLFREFLQSRSEDTFAPLEFNGVADRAAAILERCGELDTSAALRVQTQDWDSLQRLICTHGMALLAQGHTKTVRKWVAAVPAEIAAKSPWLSYWSGAALLEESPVAARALLTKAWTYFESRAETVGEMLAAAAMLETYQCEWSSYEPARLWIDRLRACLTTDAVFPSPEAELRALASWLFALTYVHPASDQLATCIARMRKLLHSDLEVNQWLFAARTLLIALCCKGNVESARELAGRMRSTLAQRNCAATVRASALHAMAYRLWFEGEFREAYLALQEAASATLSNGRSSTDPVHHLVRQLLAFADRDPQRITSSIHALRQAINPTDHLGMSILSLTLSQQAFLRGEASSALSHLGAAVTQADSACAFPMQRICRLALAAELAAQGSGAEAVRVLQQAKTWFECDAPERSRDYELVAAYVASERGDRGACLRLLTRAFSGVPFSSPVFALLPSAMGKLCMEALDCGIAGDSVRSAIERYRLRAPASADSRWPWRFKVSAMGRFRLLKGEAPIRLSRRTQRKPLELLQALIAFGGSDVGAGVLTDALWPDSEGDAGYHSLESALYRLRQLLGSPGAVTMTGGKLSLDRQQFWVDVWALEDELQRPSADVLRPAERLVRLRSLYTGHFLEHETEKPWALERRQILREKFVRAIRDIARTYESQRLWNEAANAYHSGIEVDSLAEDLHRGLIVCHRELGDHAAALQAYRRCSELLIRVLGVQPNAKTLAIYQSVRHHAVGHAG
jgi:two-component SAPR family response regulator